MGVRALRFPRIEKAVLVGFEGVLAGLLSSRCCSHGKPGGDEGGLDARVGSSENIALSARVGLDGAVMSEENIARVNV